MSLEENSINAVDGGEMSNDPVEGNNGPQKENDDGDNLNEDGSEET